MELQNCRECGQLFVGAGPSRCPKCIEAEESAYRSVVAHLEGNRDHPERLSLEECARATGVRRELVLKFIREGRLGALAQAPRSETGEGSWRGRQPAAVGPAQGLEGEPSEGSTCRICQRRIPQGRYCPSCAERLTKQLRQVGEDLARRRVDRPVDRPQVQPEAGGSRDAIEDHDRRWRMIAPDRHGRGAG